MYAMFMEMVTRAILVRTANTIRRAVLADLELGDRYRREWDTDPMEEAPGGWKLVFVNPDPNGPRKLVVTIHTEG